MSFAAQPWQPLSRSDRHVRRASLRLPAAISEHRATFLVEEALRLMALPGEDQGRTYYFRRVVLRGIAAAATSHEWVERAQSTMYALAVRAVHGTDVRAADADAVFFYSQEEALEWLLGRILRRFPGALSAAAWFAPMISPAASGADAATQIVAVIERLRSLPSGWFAAATVLLDAVAAGSADVSVLRAIPERVVRMWLSELGGIATGGGYAPRISEGRRRMLLKQVAGRVRAMSHPGLRDAGGVADAAVVARRELPVHLVWLAALAVVAEHPGELDRGSAAEAGRVVLEELVESLDGAVAEDLCSREELSPLPDVEDSPDVLDEARHATPEDVAMRKILEARDGRKPKAERELDGSFVTAAGGLYFLLNVLRVLGIEAAVESLPALIKDTFVARLVESLARAAAVATDDPAMLWVAAALESSREDARFDGMIPASNCWPRILFSAPEVEVTADRLIQVWTVAVRRWCWLNGRLTLREIVLRTGRIRLTRTDLDVTLPMDTVDLRLRRIGLDLDLGWLPWFGRVVRFHYSFEYSDGAGGAER